MRSEASLALHAPSPCPWNEAKAAFVADVFPTLVLAEARRRKGGAIDPISAYRASGYRAAVARERPAVAAGSAGIV